VRGVKRMSIFGLKDLGTKIAITALCFSLIPLIGLGVTMYSMFASAYHSKVRANLVTLAENKRQGIDLFCGNRSPSYVPWPIRIPSMT